jgi:hypothetical protein
MSLPACLTDPGQEAACLRPEGEALLAENINPATGLATDYLNHFNEISMLIGLVADMPEMMDEIRLWRPASYVEHFERSGFKGRALAIMAYRTAEPSTRGALQQVVDRLDEAILDVIALLEGSPVARFPAIAAEADACLGPLMARASGIIHGVEYDTDLFAPEATQVTVDALLV